MVNINEIKQPEPNLNLDGQIKSKIDRRGHIIFMLILGFFVFGMAYAVVAEYSRLEGVDRKSWSRRKKESHVLSVEPWVESQVWQAPGDPELYAADPAGYDGLWITITVAQSYEKESE